VIVAEGEKAADAARTIGFTATTSAGGSQAAEKTDWRPLAGKDVWILPDNDAPGRQYAATVASVLAALRPAPVVRIVELPELPEKGDIADWIDAHGDAAEPDGMREEVEALARSVEPEPPVTPLAVERPRPFPVAALPEPIRGFVTAGAKAIGCERPPPAVIAPTPPSPPTLTSAMMRPYSARDSGLLCFPGSEPPHPAAGDSHIGLAGRGVETVGRDGVHRLRHVTPGKVV
jgi:hypothetical protein